MGLSSVVDRIKGKGLGEYRASVALMHSHQRNGGEGGIMGIPIEEEVGTKRQAAI